MLNFTPFADAARLIWYAIRGGQEDALSEIETWHGRIDPLRALGADIDQRIRDAAILEAAGVPSEDVPLVAKIWAQGHLCEADLHQLHDRGINVQPAVEWARRTGRPKPAPEKPAEPPRLIEARESVGIQFMVRGVLGTREVPVGEGWGITEEPVMRRRVTHTQQIWRGRIPGGRLLPVEENSPEVSEITDDDYGPWEAIGRG